MKHTFLRTRFIASSEERNASLLAFHPRDDASKVQYRPDSNRDDVRAKRVLTIPRSLPRGTFIAISAVALLSPIVAYAAASMTVGELITKITQDVFNPLIIMMFAIATLIFGWGVVQYILGGAQSGDKTSKAKTIMIYGIIGMFIMASAWGIVSLLCNFFGTCDEIDFSEPS